eukprot:2521385-Prorocentrum_lima.AAC.1
MYSSRGQPLSPQEFMASPAWQEWSRSDNGPQIFGRFTDEQIVNVLVKLRAGVQHTFIHPPSD